MSDNKDASIMQIIGEIKRIPKSIIHSFVSTLLIVCYMLPQVLILSASLFAISKILLPTKLGTIFGLTQISFMQAFGIAVIISYCQ